ncbi:hypothetical protein KY285_024469 [Solanum tuberosum]|nr:hypothetical protein KY285_024469 [Solanum tuberosum]
MPVGLHLMTMQTQVPRISILHAVDPAEHSRVSALITLQSYCDVNNPCKRVQKVVADGSRTGTVEAVATISASPSPRVRPQAQTKCSAADKAKVKTCMTKTSSIDACCPTFRSILGKSCPCYNYAMKLDNQALITLEAYCDVNNPCNKVQAHNDQLYEDLI